MSKVTVTESYLEGIGDAIRNKLNTSQGYTPGQMAAAINSIPTGGITPTGTINITQNGQTDVTQYASAAVNVPNSYTAEDEGKVVQEGELEAQTSETITQNGAYDTTTKDEVVVDVQGGAPNLQDKTFTQNGTYTADAGYDGFDEVTVDVSGGVEPEAALSGTMTQNENGITFSERSVASNRGTIKGTEYSAGFEGFNVKFEGLTSGKTYVCVFSWETKSGAYFSGTWMYGYKVSDSPVSSYDVRHGVSGWADMIRDLSKHSYAIVFTASGTSAYLVFAIPGYSDDVNNVFELTELMVIDPANIH